MYMLIIVATSLLELLMFESGVWKIRKILIWVIMSLNIATLVLIFSQGFNLIASLLLVYVFLFKIINNLRIAKGRTSEERLKSTGIKTSLILSLVILSIVAVASYSDLSLLKILYLQYAQIFIAFLVLAITAYNIAKISKRPRLHHIFDKDLPTLSVCVPARNETEQMEICINSLLASTYPKLEIIVLDDCSTDSTPELIKKFAHAGVRFIKGSPPDDKWLPKNLAYQKLLDNALGELILFCGVDTRFAPHTLNKLVNLMLTKNLKMSSVLPVRIAGSNLSSIIQPMRYWWEIALPRNLIKSPPVLSTCWIIDRHELIKMGGFKAIKNSVLPERHIAKRIFNDRKYGFIKSSDLIDVQTVKPISDQKETAIRVRYPQVHRRPELVMALILFHGIILLMPYILLIFSLVSGNYQITILSLVAIVINLSTHLTIMYTTAPSGVPLAALNYPIVVITEIIIGLLSMYKYEFSKVDWKERNICIPVMQVIPKLPDL